MSRAPKISEAIWERHKSVIRTLYIEEDNSPEKVSEVLRDKYGFAASRHQIIRRLARWKFKKYTTKEEWVYTSSQIQRRKEQNGKKTEIVLNGKTVSEKKLSKALGRYVGTWDFGPECQRIRPCEDLTTIEIHTPKEGHGVMPYSTPWFKFWKLAEETVFTSAAIGLARSKSQNNQENLGKIMKFMSSDEQKFTEVPILISHLATALPRFHENQRHPVLEDCDSLLLQWIFYAGSNKLVSVECMHILLKWAIDNNYLRLIKDAIALGGLTVQTASRYLLPSAVGAAIEINDCVLADALTEDWVDVNKTPYSYPILPALQTASLNGNNSLLRLLVRRGGDIHAQPAVRGLTCLQAAAISGSQELVEQLLQMGARVDDYQSGNDTTVLQAAVISGSIGTVQTVLHAGAAVNDSRGVCSALYHAAYGQDPEMCAFLLRKGALVDQENRDSPLLAAIFRGSHEMANLLLEARGNPNSCTRLLQHKWSESSVPHLRYEEEDENDVQLWTPLAAACYWSDIAMIKLLLQYGAKLHKGTKFYTSPKSEKLRRSKLARSGIVGQLCSSDERAMRSCSTDGRFESPHRG
ncbi:hypothetical protein J7337_006848 [Fusarium musae]|uniref:Clr5 domain-containing protein n=1 Tax=Fusarium musae TaxID=1042133 RepID=A0A9P8DFU8_9HYPO|nr:hypothetical protein J7337_006848 [Fusarium musae]KAG9501164.1 hypothetical protein J7337_006848 [Fusarium musae]